MSQNPTESGQGHHDPSHGVTVPALAGRAASAAALNLNLWQSLRLPPRSFHESAPGCGVGPGPGLGPEVWWPGPGLHLKFMLATRNASELARIQVHGESRLLATRDITRTPESRAAATGQVTAGVTSHGDRLTP